MTLFFLPLPLPKKSPKLKGLIKAIGLIFFIIGDGAVAQSFHEGVRAFEQQDYDKAFTLFTQLASQGHIDALNNLGALYQTGRGVTKNYPKAIETYKKAAIFGHINAAYNLANLTRLGIGTPQNNPEAYAWSIVAARHGASDLIAFRDALAKDLNHHQHHQAIELALKVLEPITKDEIAQAWLIPNELEGLLFNSLTRDNPSQQGQLFTNAHLRDYPSLFPSYPPQKQLLSPPLNYRVNTSINPTNTQLEGIDTSQKLSLLTQDKTANLDSTVDDKAYDSISKALPASKEAFGERKDLFSQIILEEQPIIDSSSLVPQIIDGVLIPEGFSLLQKQVNMEKSLSVTSYSDLAESNPLQESQHKQIKKPVHFGYSTTLGHSTTTVFRAQKGDLPYYPNATILRPRRIIPIKSSPLYLEKPLDAPLQQLIENLIQAMNTPFTETLEALILINPHKFQETEQGILKEINLDKPLHIPSQEFIRHLSHDQSKEKSLPNYNDIGSEGTGRYETPHPKKK